jgi:hypothetical protein
MVGVRFFLIQKAYQKVCYKVNRTGAGGFKSIQLFDN